MHWDVCSLFVTSMTGFAYWMIHCCFVSAAQSERRFVEHQSASSLSLIMLISLSACLLWIRVPCRIQDVSCGPSKAGKWEAKPLDSVMPYEMFWAHNPPENFLHVRLLHLENLSWITMYKQCNEKYFANVKITMKWVRVCKKRSTVIYSS